ncbi:uncharacterized protein LOC105441737 isoform X2 [Strongylocentrotus purpuratus]|uniref:Uncharacterized protein n=1 Tax=Strongylocentrotus purpuratus TaxID=7668 RepID=A0A7M7NAY0_STRPU|nr:uncharacterized protein LOC105441737 isoform X2 [Strongylocentrotus purpuratus]
MLKCVLKTFLCFVFLHILGSNGVVCEPDVLVQSNGGGTARLQCRFLTTSLLGGRVSWTKDGREKIVNVTDCGAGDAITTCQVHRSSGGKYTVEGSRSVGVTLIILNVALEDDGVYDCKAVLVDGIIEKSFRLAVTYVPNEIAITDVVKAVEVSNMSTLYAVVDRPYVLNCTVPSPCNPPANITWSYGDVTAVVSEQANHSSARDSPLMTSSKSVELTASEENTAKTISCIAMHYGLAAPLQTNVILEVGRLPDSPLNAEDWISSVTVDSFTVTWSHRSSGGKPQRFTVTYCEVVRPEECSEISRIVQTRTRIENLRPFTLYRVTVKSHTVYGFSEDNEFIERSTIPMSPKELGVEGVYNSQLGRADIVRVTNISGPVPDGLCFQLVDQGFEPSADAADAAGQDCVNVGQYIVWPQGKYWTQMALVAYGNSVFSATSKMTGMEAGVGLPVIIGASVGGSVLLIIILVIIYIRTKGRSSGNARANRRLPAQPQQTRQQPGRGQNVPDDEPPPTYSGVKYQEVTDPTRSAGPLGELYTTHHSYHQAQAPQEVSGIPTPGYGNGQYYSRSITMDKKTAAAEFSDRYGYMDPIP